MEFKYTLRATGKDFSPETLEKLNYATAKANREKEDTGEEQIIERSGPVIKLEPHQTILYDNQTGVSYKSLFADYLKGATEITLQDPYIRFPYQFKNLLEFCVMLANNKDPEDEIHLEVLSWNTPDHMSDSIAYFEEFRESVSDLGIHFSFIMEDVHDRYILADNGWKITLGRGLDIFEKNEGRFNAAELDQSRRRCKACEVTYLRMKK